MAQEKKCSTQYRKHSCLGISVGMEIPQRWPEPSLPALSPAQGAQTDRFATLLDPPPSRWDPLGFVQSLEEITDFGLTASSSSQDLLADPSNPAQLGTV